MEIFTKDVELEKIKLKFLKHLQEKKEWPKYMEHASNVRKENLTSHIGSRLEEEQNRHLKEKKRLQTVLQEKDRQLESQRVKIEMARREAIEINDCHLKELEHQQKSLFDQAVSRFEAVKRETEADFKQAKEVIVFEAREEKVHGEKSFNEACVSLKHKLQDYYKDITKKDLDAIKLLKQNIKKVEEKISASKILLQDAQAENKRLSDMARPKFTKRSNQLALKFDAGPLKMIAALKMHNRTEKLSIENQKLEEQIKLVMEQTYELRRQFTSALKKVRDSAENKPAILENKLNFILEGKSSESGSIETEFEKEDSEGTVTENE